ncbi:MAG: acyl-CoA thioesterase, partial [Candidatus Omnitrophica bacterium]|nr:acyl-CoA thioesterase [Candidatus Omnitrophota bacterium]
CYFTMVALDKSGKPTPVPNLICETAVEKRRFKEGQIRREHAKELAEKRRKQ